MARCSFGILVKPEVDIDAPWRKGYTSGRAKSLPVTTVEIKSKYKCDESRDRKAASCEKKEEAKQSSSKKARRENERKC